MQVILYFMNWKSKVLKKIIDYHHNLHIRCLSSGEHLKNQERLNIIKGGRQWTGNPQNTIRIFHIHKTYLEFSELENEKNDKATHTKNKVGK